MAASTWKYLDNQFDNATAESYRRMFILCTDHDSRLDGRKSEPAIAPLAVRFHPVYEAYAVAYSQWTAASGATRGGVAAVQAQLDLLSSTKARQWDVKTLAVFDSGTPEHTAIWPDGRGPLQTGAIDPRIAAVKALHTRMQPHAAALGAPLLAEVLAFHAVLLALRNTQQGREGAKDADTTALEAARVATAEMMYGNLGLLMDAFRATPAAVADFFDLSIIRDTAPAEPLPATPA
jgi:hypothetical protein